MGREYTTEGPIDPEQHDEARELYEAEQERSVAFAGAGIARRQVMQNEELVKACRDWREQELELNGEDSAFDNALAAFVAEREAKARLDEAKWWKHQTMSTWHIPSCGCQECRRIANLLRELSGQAKGDGGK
jgi:hypothetical protein